MSRFRGARPPAPVSAQLAHEWVQTAGGAAAPAPWRGSLAPEPGEHSAANLDMTGSVGFLLKGQTLGDYILA